MIYPVYAASEKKASRDAEKMRKHDIIDQKTAERMLTYFLRNAYDKLIRIPYSYICWKYGRNRFGSRPGGLYCEVRHCAVYRNMSVCALRIRECTGAGQGDGLLWI